MRRVLLTGIAAWLGLAWGVGVVRADLRISEFVAAAQTTLADEDGAYGDWVEIENPDTAAVDLLGWYLTDSPENLTKWEFPSATLPAGGRLVVFGSDKDRAVAGAPLHTNFKLDAGTGYLALVRPDGSTVAHAYAAYPQQYADVSYGESGGEVGHLESPTPGQPNAPLAVRVPSFSPRGCFFTGTLTLTLSASTPTGTIRFTTNGTDPSLTNGLTYTQPLGLQTTLLIRAAVFDGGRRSPIVTQRYVRIAPNAQSFNSNLPLVLVHTFGAGIGEDAQTRTFAAIIDTGTGGRANITDPPDHVGVVGLKLRGSSSLSFPKKQYAFELWDEIGEDLHAQLLDFPEESDFVLYGPYTDKTLMRDVLAYQWSNAAGRWAPRTRFVECFLNTVGGGITTSDYLGVYVLIEKIKRDKQRVNIKKLRVDDSAPPAITGGYILKKDRLDPGDSGFWTSTGQNLCYVDPKEQEITPTQAAWLTGYFNAFEAALAGPNFADPLTGYAQYIDPASWIDHHILVELLKNIDGFRLSTFMYKDRGGRLCMGPLWDYNLALGNADYLDGWLPTGWYNSLLGNDDYPYWRRLFEDPAFRLQYADRWFGLRRQTFATARLLADIDAHAALLAEAQVRNFQKWPILGVYVWPNAPGWAQRLTYQSEVDWMKQWLTQRLAWMDTQFLGPPVFNQEGGAVPYGFALTMAPPPGVTGTVYYTLDGSDPYFAAQTTTVLVPESAAKRVRVPTGAIASWTAPGFNDAAWTAGTGGVGYERSTGYEGLFNIDVGAAMYGINGTCYIRVPFTVADPSGYNRLTLRVRYDDGFVAYLNGQEVARTPNAPATPTWNSIASSPHDDSLAVQFEDFDLTAHLGRLVPGTNVLALHGLNAGVSSSDFLISCELQAQASVSGQTLMYTEPIPLTASTRVKARVLSGGTWGALNDAVFTVGPVVLYINEFMAENHVTIEDPDEPGEYPDWLELYNPGLSPVFLGGMYLTDNLANPTKWRIPDALVIPAGGYLVFWCDEDQSQGPTHTNFKLSKSGEEIGLFDTAAHNHAPLDTIVFGPQGTDVSFGRSPDGSGRWRTFRRATPGGANVYLGDLNCDRVVNFDDIDAFVVALSGQAPYEAAYPQCLWWNADCNADGAVNFDDIDAFVAALAGG